MAIGVVTELIVGLVVAVVIYAFTLVELHNRVVSYVYSSGLVISTLNAQVGDVIYWAIVAIPLFIIVGGCYYAYADMVYKTGS